MELTITSSLLKSSSEWRKTVNFWSQDSTRETTMEPPSPLGTHPPAQISQRTPAPLLTLATARRPCSRQILSLPLLGALQVAAEGVVVVEVQVDIPGCPPVNILAPYLRTGRLPTLKIMKNISSSKFSNTLVCTHT